MVSLTGKVAIVTGAAQGLGQAYCLALAQEGARVVAADIQSCDDTAAQIQAAGGTVLPVSVDVTSEQETEAMARQTLQTFGRLDILVNNAAFYGGLKRKPFDQIPVDEWDKMMAVNVKGMWLCCKAVTPAMKQQGQGKIINISSGTVWVGVPMLLHYVASKGAVLSLTRALARELSGTGITVNAITPGFTMTEASKTLDGPEAFENIRQRLLNMQIIKRSEEPSDLTGTVIFLASAASDFITGQTINVDGGMAHH